MPYKFQNNSERTPDIKPRLLDVPAAAQYLGRTTRAIQGLVASGAVPVVRIDGRVQFDVRDLDRMIEEKKSEVRG